MWNANRNNSRNDSETQTKRQEEREEEKEKKLTLGNWKQMVSYKKWEGDRMPAQDTQLRWMRAQIFKQETMESHHCAMKFGVCVVFFALPSLSSFQFFVIYGNLSQGKCPFIYFVGLWRILSQNDRWCDWLVGENSLHSFWCEVRILFDSLSLSLSVASFSCLLSLSHYRSLTHSNTLDTFTYIPIHTRCAR